MKKIFITIFLSMLIFGSFAQMLSKPILQIPADGETSAMPYQKFLWKAVASLETLKYTLEIGDNEEMVNANLYETTIPEKFIGNLIYGKTYYWRVKAHSSAGSSEASDLCRFTVRSTITANNSSVSSSINMVISVDGLYTSSVNTSIERSYALAGIDGFEYYFSKDSIFSLEDPTTYSELISKEVAGKTYDNGKIISYQIVSLNKLQYGATYYYKVRVYSGNDSKRIYSDWSQQKNGRVQRMEVVKAPTLESPYNGDSYDMKNDFKWKEIKGTNEYVLEISESEDFSGVKIVQTTSTGKVKPKNIGFNKTYYWRVKAISLSGESEYSAGDSIDGEKRKPWKFTTPDQKPTLVSPIDGTVQKSNPVYFVFDKIPGADRYALEFYTPNTNPKEIIERTIIRDEDEVDIPTVSVTKYLEFNKKIEWAVKAYVASDSTTISDSRTIMVDFSSPSLVFPANNMTVNNLVNVKWETLLGATGYEIEYASDDKFTKGVSLITIKDPMQTNVEVLFPAGQDYYIKMRARAGEKYSDYCEVRMFHAGISQPIVLSPLHKYEGNPMLVVSPVTFTWSPVYGLSDYIIEYSKDIEFADVSAIKVEYVHGLGIDQLQDIVIPEGVYYWRMKGVVWQFNENGDIVVNEDGVRQTVDKSLYSLVGNFKVVAEIGVDNLEADLLSIYPNPCKNNLIVDKINLDGKKGVFITDITGKRLITQGIDDVCSNGKLEINVSSLKSGVYFLTIESDKQSLTRKFIKE